MPDWYYAANNQQLGPVQFEQLQAMSTQGQLAPADLVWTEGMAQWQPAAQIQGLNQMPPPMVSPPTSAAGFAPQSVGYAQPYYAPPSQHAGLALTSMILSLVSIVMLGPLLSIPGAICGWVALKGMKRTGDVRNRGFALTGLWVGLIWTALWALFVAIIVIVIVNSKP